MLEANRLDGEGRPGWNAGRRLPAEVLSAADVESLLRLATVRGRAMIVCMYRGGLRVAELVKVAPWDVDVRAGTIHVRYGKRSKGQIAYRERTVGIDPGAAAILTFWIERRRALEVPRSAPLFCTRDGRELAPQNVRLMLARLRRRAGLEQRIHPHAFRHSMAAGMAREGIPLPLIQAQLGHSSLTSTDRYVRHLSGQHVAAAAARPWPASSTASSSA